MNYRQILSQAADILEANDWCKGAFARDCEKKPCSVINANLQSYCMMGAVVKVLDNQKYEPFIDYHAVDQILKQKGFYMMDWNDLDCRSKEEAVAKLRELANWNFFHTGFPKVDKMLNKFL